MITNNRKNEILNKFRKWLSQHGQLPIETWKISLKYLRIREVKRNTILVKHDENEDFFRFIYSGIIKREYHENNRSFVNEFEIGPVVSGKVISLTPEKECEKVSLTTITTTVLIEMKLTDVMTCFTSHPALQVIALSITNTYISSLLDNMSRIRLTTAEDYYHYLIKEQPSIIKYAKMEDIASYLNITPSSLSRIRKLINTSI